MKKKKILTTVSSSVELATPKPSMGYTRYGLKTMGFPHYSLIQGKKCHLICYGSNFHVYVGCYGVVVTILTLVLRYQMAILAS